MHILMVAARYLPTVGGTEIHTAEVSTRLVARGHQVTVVTADATDAPAGTPDRATVDGVDIVRLPARLTGPEIRFSRPLYRYVREWTGDVIHVQGYHTLSAPTGLLAARHARLPHVLTFHSGGHSSRLNTAIRPVQRAGLRPLLASADHLIGVSDFERDTFITQLRLPAERFSTIPNGADFDVDALAALPPIVPDGIRRIATVGRLEKYKGHHRVIAAMPELLRRCPGVQLQIIGTGPYEPDLRAQVAELGLTASVEFQSFPAANRAGMVDALRRADLVTLMSDYESQGMAAVEALVLGRPLVVADNSALGELARRYDVTAVPVNASPAQLAITLAEVLLNPPPVAVPSVFRWEDAVDRLEACYEAVLHARSVPVAS